jgi:hypothetical protein
VGTGIIANSGRACAHARACMVCHASVHSNEEDETAFGQPLEAVEPDEPMPAPEEDVTAGVQESEAHVLDQATLDNEEVGTAVSHASEADVLAPKLPENEADETTGAHDCEEAAIYNQPSTHDNEDDETAGGQDCEEEAIDPQTQTDTEVIEASRIVNDCEEEKQESEQVYDNNRENEVRIVYAVEVSQEPELEIMEPQETNEPAETSLEHACLPWSITGSDDRPTIQNTCGLDSMLWLLDFLESNQLLVLPIVDTLVSKESRKELLDTAIFDLMGCVDNKEDDTHIQNWVNRGGLFKECSDLLGSGHPDRSRLKCLKELSSNLRKPDVCRKIKKYSWTELSGQMLNARSSTVDWLQLAGMSLGYWYSTIQVCSVCKKTVNTEMPNWRLFLPVDDIHNHTIDDVASLIDGGLSLQYLRHTSCQNSKRHLKMVWHSLPHLLFVKQMGEGDLWNSNSDQILFLERRKKICVSLHCTTLEVRCFSECFLVIMS